jgi:hypothetical protein
VALLTESAVRQRASQLTAALKKSAGLALDEMARTDAAAETVFDVFLSHSSSEPDELLLGVNGMLQDEGLSVYVDRYTDPHLLPNKITSATAKILRMRLKSSRSLLYVYSQYSTKSRWMPWELGFADGLGSRVGVIPVTKNQETEFKGEEYLNLYPYVDIAPVKDTARRIFWINSSNNYYARLAPWLRKEEAIKSHS